MKNLEIKTPSEYYRMRRPEYFSDSKVSSEVVLTKEVLALELEKMVVGGTQAVFRTFFEPGRTFHQFRKEMEKQHPLKVSDRGMESGFLALTDSNESSLFGAYLMI